MTFMPNPGLMSCPRPEVRLSVVVDLGGEAEEAAEGAGVGFHGGGGETVLLCGALQRIHGPVLQVGGLLYNLSVEDQVWSRWEGERQEGFTKFISSCDDTAFSLKIAKKLPQYSAFVFWCILLEVHETPAAKRPPPLGQWRCFP